MQNHKNLARQWQRTSPSQHPPPQTSSSCSSKLAAKQEAVLVPSCPTSKDYEKLRRKMWEMKHRVCLLEFGLGSVAKLMQDLNGSSGPQGTGGDEVEGAHRHKMTSGNNGGENNLAYKEVLKGIGEVLQDVETCMKSSSNCSPSIMRGDLVNHATVPVASGPVQLLKSETASHSGKTRIFIDETKPGENSLTMTTPSTNDLCNIQVVENHAAMFPLPSTSSLTLHQLKATQVDVNGSMSYQSHKNEYYVASSKPIMLPLQSSSSFDALSTLASVASSKHAEEMMIRSKSNDLSSTTISTRMQASEQHIARNTAVSNGTTPGSQQLVNPFLFTEEEEDADNVPSKIRQRSSITMASQPENSVKNANGEGRMSTRRKRRRQRYHQL